MINTCQTQKETLFGWAMRKLGYGACAMPDFENDPYNRGYVESSLQSEVYVVLGWADTIRLLFSRRLLVKTATKTDVVISRSYAKSAVGVLPPGHRR